MENQINSTPDAMKQSLCAPQCPKQVNASNVPGSTAATASPDECGLPIPLATPVTSSPIHPEYASIAATARLHTFKDWPESIPQKPEDLAAAGSYYTGEGDATKCYYYGVGLKDWKQDYEPWEQHARWYERCHYVYLVKGHDYVEKLLADLAAVESESKADTSTSTTETTEIQLIQA